MSNGHLSTRSAEHRQALRVAVDAARRRQIAFEGERRTRNEIRRHRGESHREFGVRQARAMVAWDRQVMARIVAEAGRG